MEARPWLEIDTSEALHDINLLVQRGRTLRNKMICQTCHRIFLRVKKSMRIP